MQESEYPALYVSANKTAIEVQAHHFLLLRITGWLLLASAAITLIGGDGVLFAIMAAIVFFSLIGVTAVMTGLNYETSWYKARALAESVKSLTWRYVMKAEPFSANNGAADAEFRTRLAEVLAENKDVFDLLVVSAKGAEITSEMRRLRQSSLEERKEVYREDRVREQRQWYAEKSEWNRRKRRKFLAFLFTAQGLAAASVLFSIGYPGFDYWPTEVFIVSASIVLTWATAKRFSELAAAYGLAAHEIGIIDLGIDEINSDMALSDFVRDSETAFSREHTQWAARKE